MFTTIQAAGGVEKVFVHLICFTGLVLLVCILGCLLEALLDWVAQMSRGRASVACRIIKVFLVVFLLTDLLLLLTFQLAEVTRHIKMASPTKVLTSVRLDADILEFFKSKGAGYQSRINAALRAEMDRNLTRRPSATTRKRIAA